MPQQDIIITSDASDISLGPDDMVTITSPSLLNSLVKASSDTVTFLSSQVAPITLDAISVDDEGRVVIADPTFASTLRSTAAAALQTNASNNGVCGNVKCAQRAK